MNHPQQGMALIEVLVASAVLGMGLLGATQLTLQAMQTASETRQQGVARWLAQQAMDCARSGSTCPSRDSTEVQGVRYTCETRIGPGPGGVLEVAVTVQWSSPQSTEAGAESGAAPTRLAWHSRVSPVPAWVGR